MLEGQSSNYRPGEPLRPWSADSDVACLDLGLVAQAANATEVLKKFADGESLSLEEQIVIANMNSWCFLFWYEPLVTQVAYPQASEKVIDMIKKFL